MLHAGTSTASGGEEACVAEGIRVRSWRSVPVDSDALGREARASAPRIDQAVLEARPGMDPELRAFRARRRLDGRDDVYVASLSFRTVTYKALCAADQLAAFYDDLRDPALEIPFGIFHQRFSTNTTPSWERAQPFRLPLPQRRDQRDPGQRQLDARPRVAALGARRRRRSGPSSTTGSDSAMLDNALELLVRGGRDIRHGVHMLVPPAWQTKDASPSTSAASTATTRASSSRGTGRPGLVFTDGRVVGATLDRNGLRPLRCRGGDGLVVCSSEVGTFDLPEGRHRAARAALGPRSAARRRPDDRRPRARTSR